MNFGNLKILARACVPAAKANKIDDVQLALILNNGKNDVALKTICLKKNEKFDAVAEQKEYLLSTVLTDFLIIDKSGLWWSNGSQYRQLEPYTLKKLDEDFPYWRDASSGSPQRYSIDGNVITVHPKPNITLTSGFWIYYGAKSLSMSADSDYTFSGSIEIPHLSILDDAILDYWKWQAYKITGEKEDVIRAAKDDYLREIEDKIFLLNKRIDISASRYTKFQGTKF